MIECTKKRPFGPWQTSLLTASLVSARLAEAVLSAVMRSVCGVGAVEDDKALSAVPLVNKGGEGSSLPPMPKVEMPKLELPKGLPKLELPKGLPKLPFE